MKSSGDILTASRKFEELRIKRLQGLSENGTFELVTVADIAEGTCIFGLRFMVTTKVVRDGM